MNTQKNEPTKCAECGGLNAHAITCEKQNKEQWREKALLYYASWQRRREEMEEILKTAVKKQNRLRDLVTFWQGKFNAVRRENNQLRKQARTRK